MKNKLICCLLVAVPMMMGCSSLPKGPVEVTTMRTQAAQDLDLANQAADDGDYANALAQVKEARRLAVGADDCELRIRTQLAEGNILYGLGKSEEGAQAFSGAGAEAGTLSEAEGGSELRALCSLYRARAALTPDAASPDTKQLRASVAALLPVLKGKVLDQALCYRTLALADKNLQQYDAALSDINEAINLHNKGYFLKAAAWDYYFEASIYSVSGRYDQALASLQQALELDRRTENTAGLASDWEALAEVYGKAGKADQAKAAKVRAQEIQKSMQ
jgi:tetratricopeptide (TPR) repeat protein